MEAVSLSSSPPVSTMLVPEASGTEVYSNAKAYIDASNLKDGYVMVKYLGTSTSRVKVLITGPSTVSYQYNLKTDGSFEVFPLSDGNGSYKIGVYQNVSGSSYSTLLAKTLSVALTDEFAPFLLPNQYVNYSEDSKAVALAKELTLWRNSELDKVQAIYEYVIGNITYDKEKAQNVKSGYLPDIDEILELKKGICFDYAALMAAMLRSQGVAAKLVVGYAGTAYHAWINVYTKETGWIEAVIYFDGADWKLMDPTFASTANSSKAIMDYINDSSNYTAKYFY
jgi:transglutaminase-like putative cysteine protease